VKESLGYRKHARVIRQGIVPEKYTRVAQYVIGHYVLEVGSAEGVLALTLANEGREVVAVEQRLDRHATAMELKEAWRKRGKRVDSCTLINENILERLDLLQNMDTLVAVRSIYYLRENVRPFFVEVAKHVRHVVLCGNPGRWPRCRDQEDRLGEFNYYASSEGMRELLDASGYQITQEIKTGDPIVVGKRH